MNEKIVCTREKFLEYTNKNLLFSSMFGKQPLEELAYATNIQSSMVRSGGHSDDNSRIHVRGIQ